jgi:hypothetical protein
MNGPDNTTRILVAIDGSGAALHAAHWASAEATRHGLTIVHAYDWPLRTTAGRSSIRRCCTPRSGPVVIARPHGSE